MTGTAPPPVLLLVALVPEPMAVVLAATVNVAAKTVAVLASKNFCKLPMVLIVVVPITSPLPRLRLWFVSRD
ncbi:MAG: hypothetical protein WAV47_26155 [Blastocatellia bacterium]